ncbi:protein phosphatase inhibitor 2-like isoform X4 [Alosa sapidissima]|uniref:protein phosphatase inhibitor 2-like isoform X4 n=1 Tax=Alosa sapidissima TaxID=34773 RepID=UPI001C082F82|nr:protein phosphatase inhibitor 2-like isoform X4 [Alosa sapidissima]
MGMDDPGPSKPLKGILKGTSRQQEPTVHQMDCPMSASAAGLPQTNLQSSSGTDVANAQGRQLKGILRNNLSDSVSDSNGKKRRCSITMLDDEFEEDRCLCKRKKSQSWDEISILETQHPSTQDTSSTQPCRWGTGNRTCVADGVKEDCRSIECFPEPQPMSPQPDPEPQAEESLEHPKPLDQVQVMDTSPVGMHLSLEAVSKAEGLEEDSTDKVIGHDESTHFEELRKAYIRESRQVLLDKAFQARCSDEDENDEEAENGTFPDLSLASAADSADAAHTDGSEWSGQTS